jgi:hypothetical protein
VTTKTDLVESSRKILNAPAPSLSELEAAAAALDQVRGGLNVEIAGSVAHRMAILASDASAAEVDKHLEKHDEAVRALVRRNEVAGAIATKLAARLVVARDVAAEEKRQAAYAAARKLHDDATIRMRAFLDKVAPEAREVMQVYAAAEAATVAANRDLPAGAAPIMSIEARRQGEPVQPRITERHFKAFTCGRDYVAEVGAVEATPAAGGTWTLYLPSASVQGGSTVGGCVITDMVDLRIEKFESRRVESLATALRAPPFYATAPERGTVERKRMRLSEWRQINGEPVEAEQVHLQVAAE